jgi:hypothetical protein
VIPSYRETSVSRNTAIYERLAFVVRDHLQPADPGGPPCWRMVRPDASPWCEGQGT